MNTDSVETPMAGLMTLRLLKECLAEYAKVGGFGLFPVDKSVAKVLDEFNYVMFTKGRFRELFPNSTERRKL